MTRLLKPLGAHAHTLDKALVGVLVTSKSHDAGGGVTLLLYRECEKCLKLTLFILFLP